jgi:hypothetical protein
MYSRLIVNIAAMCILAFASSTGMAQVASSKSLSDMYNKKIKEELAKKGKLEDISKPIEKQRNLPSSKTSLEAEATGKIKNPEMIAHSSSIRTGEKDKNKLPGNSKNLKEIGIAAGNPRALHVHEQPRNPAF